MSKEIRSSSITFLCSCLDPGRDGVGDYVRRLAGELTRSGWQCSLISLNDKAVATAQTEIQYDGDIALNVLRLPANLAFSERICQAKEWIEGYSPEWLSLQFVPFGYHPKGLKLGLGKAFAEIGRGRKWHIMFHELWVGMAAEESAKLKFWGAAQRILIRSLIKRVRPSVITTQTALYKTLLAKLRYDAVLLPLFGNIPVLHPHAPASNELNFVVFGSIHDRAPIDEFSAEAAAYGREHNLPVTLTIIGRPGAEHKRWASAWEDAGLNVQMVGEQPAHEVSRLLAMAHFGICATALAVIEKSGSFAAMREHGLNVISVSKEWTPIGVPALPIPIGVKKYTPGGFTACVHSEGYSECFTVQDVARKFLDALTSPITT